MAGVTSKMMMTWKFFSLQITSNNTHPTKLQPVQSSLTVICIARRKSYLSQVSGFQWKIFPDAFSIKVKPRLFDVRLCVPKSKTAASIR